MLLSLHTDNDVTAVLIQHSPSPGILLTAVTRLLMHNFLGCQSPRCMCQGAAWRMFEIQVNMICRQPWRGWVRGATQPTWTRSPSTASSSAHTPGTWWACLPRCLPLAASLRWCGAEPSAPSGSTTSPGLSTLPATAGATRCLLPSWLPPLPTSEHASAPIVYACAYSVAALAFFLCMPSTQVGDRLGCVCAD